jgi:MoxR-like ATPase
MQRGGFLYIEELNRAPEDTLNALLTAMAEREVEVPRVGRIRAQDSFRVVASMNPFDNVGTLRISTSFYDRLCRLVLGYQSAPEDEEIVALRTGCTDGRLVTDAVALTRATRQHPDVRQGSSVRGAIDLVAVARSLAEVRGIDIEDAHADLVLDAALVALSARISLEETSPVTAEEVIRQLWENHFVLGPHRAATDGRPVGLPNPI